MKPNPKMSNKVKKMATVSFERPPRIDKKAVKPFNFKKKKKPLELTFDNAAREEFLTGFHKRKVQRKKKAQDDLEKELKAERLRLKKEAKNALKKLVVSHRDIPGLGEIQEDTNIVDMGTHEVQITELDADKLARDNNWIGPNHARLEPEPPEEDEQQAVEPDNEIEGMEATSSKKKKLAKTEENDLSKMTVKDVKKYVKKVATKNVQKSKVFQKKKDVEARKNKKIKMRNERRHEKEMKMRGKRNKRKKH